MAALLSNDQNLMQNPAPLEMLGVFSDCIVSVISSGAGFCPTVVVGMGTLKLKQAAKALFVTAAQSNVHPFFGYPKPSKTFCKNGYCTGKPKPVKGRCEMFSFVGE